MKESYTSKISLWAFHHDSPSRTEETPILEEASSFAFACVCWQDCLLLLLRLPFAVVPLAVGGMHSILARAFVVFSRKEEVTRIFLC